MQTWPAFLDPDLYNLSQILEAKQGQSEIVLRWENTNEG